MRFTDLALILIEMAESDFFLLNGILKLNAADSVDIASMALAHSSIHKVNLFSRS